MASLDPCYDSSQHTIWFQSPGLYPTCRVLKKLANLTCSSKFLGKGDFFRVMWPAWTHAMTVANIQSGFKKTGIFPVSFEAIDKEKFTPSSVTDNKILCSYTLSFPFKFILLVSFNIDYVLC